MGTKFFHSSRARLIGLAASSALLASACASGGGVPTVVESSAPPQSSAPSLAGAGAGALQALEQSALWPAASTLYDTPDAAAKDFVTNALGVTPNLSEFMQGDNRSGEFTLYSPGEGGTTPVQRGTIGVRQLGPSSGWYVTFMLSDGQQITVPAPDTKIGACETTVNGVGRGFEGTINVKAFVPGNPTPIDQAVGAGGSAADPANWSVSLDLTSASGPVTLVAQGGVGLEQDPGETSASAVIVDPSISCGGGSGGGTGGGDGSGGGSGGGTGGGTDGGGSGSGSGGGDGGIKMTG